ncbi:MAG: uroporphyrinogen-III synthase [Paracoccaceae bacterium]|nr:uroporphyrinogen-III synthase [Paracoccaceae bacterium]
MPVLLTRPAAQNEAVARALAEDGIDCAIWPLTKIVLTSDAIEIPAETDGLLFTSANGVRALASLSSDRDLPALCVGPATDAAARDAGFADVRSADGDAQAVAALARGSGLKALFHARGAETAGDLRTWLASDGVTVDEAVLYRAEETGPPTAPIAAALLDGSLNPITIWSPRAAEIIAPYLDDAPLGQVTLIAISENAATPLSDAGWARIIIAEHPSGNSMIAAIRRNSYGNAH